MKTSIKKIWFVCMLVLVSFGALSCAREAVQDNSETPKITVAMVTTVGGLGDQGFNDAGWAGVQRAVEELGIEARFIQSDEQADYPRNLSVAAEEADLVIAMGYPMKDAVTEVSASRPDRKFVYIDAEVDAPNVASYLFRTEEAAYLAGMLASATSNSGKVGVVRGMDVPPVEAYLTGFQAGLRTYHYNARKRTELIYTTAGSFDDPAKGRAQAETLIGKGCDVILQLAGNTGLGVLEAVRDSNTEILAIGADINQDSLIPGRVLVSILKRIDNAVFSAIQDVSEGRFVAGSRRLGLAEEGVGLSDMEHAPMDRVPEDVLAGIAEAHELIIQGQLVIPAHLHALRAWHTPELEAIEIQEFPGGDEGDLGLVLGEPQTALPPTE